MSSCFTYIYLNEIDNDSDRKFTVHLQNTLSNNAVDFLTLPKLAILHY